MKIKTSELTGAALDWSVAWAENITIKHFSGVFYLLDGDEWNPTRNWAQGGPIIERERIGLDCDDQGIWFASYDLSEDTALGASAKSPLVAAMRCYVATKLGNEIEIPQELTT